MIIPIKILVSFGIGPVDPFNIRFDEQLLKSVGCTGAYFKAAETGDALVTIEELSQHTAELIALTR